MKLNFPCIRIGMLAATILLAGSGSLNAAGDSPRFQDECSECHGKAAEFVSDWLEFRNGKLTGMGSEKPVAEFLRKHRDLTQQDIEYYVDYLTRVAGEIGLQ